MKRNYFDQFKKQIKQENKKYDTLNEQKTLTDDRCDHSKVRIERDRLICPCGAVWRGAGIEQAHRHLTNVVE